MPSVRPRCRASVTLLLVFGALFALPACRTIFPKEKPPPPLPVRRAPEEVVVAAWSEPKQLPPGGGQAQIVVRTQRRGGAPFAGVEVRLSTSRGRLFSGGRVLVTDGSGHTRDRLTSARTAHITLNAGGTVYRFDVAVRTAE